MINNIPQMQMPDWLSFILKNQRNVPFQIERILRDSLFYPACGLNGTPVKYLAGNVFSFVYVDYEITKDTFFNNLHGSGENDGFKNYHLIFEKDVNQIEIFQVVRRGSLFSEETDRFRFFENENEPFYHWSVWQRNEECAETAGPEGFSMFYVFSEASTFYKELYNRLSIAPKILTIIQPGQNKEGLPPDNEDSEFKFTVLSNEVGLPEYLLYGGDGAPEYYLEPCWHEYSGERIVQLPERYAGLWKLNP